MPDIITDFANEGIRQADRIIDELDEIMKKLEDAGILSGWTQFHEGSTTIYTTKLLTQLVVDFLAKICYDILRSQKGGIQG